MISSMTDDTRKLVTEYLDLADATQQNLADAIHKHPNQVSKALTGKSGQIPPLWQAIFKACKLKLIAVPEDLEIEPLELVRDHALKVRGSDDKLREVTSDG